MKPMVLTKDNVIATMEDRKRMTRRIINPQPKIIFNSDITFKPLIKPSGVVFQATSFDIDRPRTYTLKPRFEVGDEVYVAEGYQITEPYGSSCVRGLYLADNSEFIKGLTKHEWDLFLNRKCKFRPTPGRFMYKSLARTFMKITEVRVERLQEISFDGCKAEGCGLGADKCFAELWDSIHGNGAWDLNPYIFVFSWELIRR